MEQKRAPGLRQDLKIETWQKGVKLKDGTLDMWYSANIYKIMFLVSLIMLSLHSNGWLDDNELGGNSCHIILRYWHCICLGLRKTTKNLLRPGGTLIEVQNGHLLNISHKFYCLNQPAQSQKLYCWKIITRRPNEGNNMCTHTHTSPPHTHTHADMSTLERSEWQQT